MYQNTIYDEGQIINPFECMKLLNYFYDENIDLVKMNEQLREENKELKAKVDDKEVAVEVETCKVMEKIFDLIDKKIKEADEGFEQTYDSWYQGQIDALKELKKELQ